MFSILAILIFVHGNIKDVDKLTYFLSMNLEKGGIETLQITEAFGEFR